MRRFLMATTACLAVAQPGLASDTALIVGNGDYRALADVTAGDGLIAAASSLSGSGLTVIEARNATARDLTALMDQLQDSATTSDGDIRPGRLVVLLSGRFVTSGLDTWLLPVDAPKLSRLTDLSQNALPLSTVLAILATQPGQSLLGLATDDDQQAAGPFLTTGLGPLAIPQGVTVISGTASALEQLATDTLGQPGAAIVPAATALGLTVSGYTPLSLSFTPKAPDAPAERPKPPAPALSDTERSFWDQTRTADTETGYTRYLDRYPDGAFTAEATQALTEIRSEPNRNARLAEDQLALSQDARREVQRDLSLLEFNPKGIDGIFGPGSRAAIAEWQRRNDAEPTGYLTTTQIARLDGQAERRAAQLEAEAEARRLDQERQDRAFWQETGAIGDEAGLRAYLKRYPDGIHVDDATAALAEIEEAKLAKVAGQERKLWDSTRKTDTAQAYQAYLKAFPQGAFAAEADTRLAELKAADAQSAELSAAAAAEAALQLPGFTKQILEQRLAALNLDPGAVDGTFDADTRRALRRYQTARDLPATGYVNQATIVRLLADAVGQ
ncbi:peptidoglycan-binding protein [Pseudoruegeria sp. SK021]|uniref:peptidoglycan-binding protein n=1 Tax=Pseudoruegeria sp. SK021 TaxID=1933035 RepID=UPI000A247E9B|nr:peptidoglycan-binding protein [Pseudoruegeria sp. SK021]OSP56350.1 hypothetical protein BV911_03440 [Pseudoruegeria sp. SK021]